MIYFVLPNAHFQTFTYLNLEYSEKKPNIAISNSLSYYLYDIKFKIDKFEKDWDNFKKYTNPYEYVNTPPPNKNKCISKYKPLSRSFYKMIEIINVFSLINTNENIKTFSLAEGPGGFIEALVYKRKNINDEYYGISLLEDSNDPNIPAWKKSDDFLKNNSNVFIDNGYDNTGDILSINNFEYIVKKYGSSMDLVTADGGFDFSLDFNNQETNMNRLLFSQIVYAICLQKKNGCFVLKIFDSFLQQTIDLLYLLSSFYKLTYITKPQTSRYANSEKYIVCKGFLFDNNIYFKDIVTNIFSEIISNNKFVNRYLDINISNIFINKLEEYNSIFGQQQIETINNTIALIENKLKIEKIETLIKNNIQKSINWCNKNDIPCNNISNSNVFLNDT